MFAPRKRLKTLFQASTGDETSLKLRAEWYSAQPAGFSTGGAGAVPEPGTLSLLGSGLAGLAGVFGRRFRS
jgi:hypothetical protein